MPRVQAMVVRDGRVLMVKHRGGGEDYWCLPGGALEPGDTPEQGAVRELRAMVVTAFAWLSEQILDDSAGIGDHRAGLWMSEN